MSQCPRCHQSHDTEDRFCGFCGYNLTVQNDSAFVTVQAIDSNQVQLDLGTVYFQEGKYSEALEIFEEVLRNQQDNIRALQMIERCREACEPNSESPEHN